MLNERKEEMENVKAKVNACLLASKTNRKKVEKLAKKYGLKRNRYSYTALYNQEINGYTGFAPWKTYTYTNDVIRVSADWNYTKDGEGVCAPTDFPTIVNHVYVCRWNTSKNCYTLLEEALNDEEIKLELRMLEKAEERRKKEYEKREKEIAKRLKLTADAKENGGWYLVEYQTSTKSGKWFNYHQHEEICYVKGCWAYTSNGRKRTFTIVRKAKKEEVKNG